MNVYLIFAWIWAAMIATAFWEAYVEGRSAGNHGKFGWEIRFTRDISLTAYHFYLFFVMWPLLVTLPLVVNGWDTRLFGILVSAYFTGLIIEDFTWFIVNPMVKFSEWNPKFVDYYPWVRIGKRDLPVLYITHLAVAVIAWWLFWA